MGAITSSRNPPQIETNNLEKLSNRVEKYTYERNYDFLLTNRSKSIVFQTWANKYVDALTYYIILTSVIVFITLLLFINLFRTKGKDV